jgi:hypothetical protein
LFEFLNLLHNGSGPHLEELLAVCPENMNSRAQSLTEMLSDGPCSHRRSCSLPFEPNVLLHKLAHRLSAFIHHPGASIWSGRGCLGSANAQELGHLRPAVGRHGAIGSWSRTSLLVLKVVSIGTLCQG